MWLVPGTRLVLVALAATALLAPAAGAAGWRFRLVETTTFRDLPGAMVLRDVDGDRIADYVGTTTARDEPAGPGPGTGHVVVMRGLGNGRFGALRSYRVGRRPMHRVAIVRLNRDPYPDLVTVSRDDRAVSVLLGRGRRGFSPATSYPVGPDPWLFGVFDMNRDGFDDLVIPSLTSATLDVVLARGDGSMMPRVTYEVGGTVTAAPTTALALGYLDRDRRPDAVAVSTAGSMSVLLGQGRGALGKARTQRVARAAASVTIADLNGDRRADVVVAGGSAGAIAVLIGRGDGSFRPARAYRTGGAPTRVVVADQNRDGRRDLVVDDPAAVLFGTGRGTFRAPVRTRVTGRPRMLADLDGDRVFDLVQMPGKVVALLRGRRDGRFAEVIRLRQPTDFAQVAVGDLNRDGLKDLVVSHGDDFGPAGVRSYLRVR